MTKVLNPKELLALLYKRHKNYAEICRRTGLNKSTLKRIRRDEGKGKWHPKTLGKLAKALNEAIA